MTMDGDATTIDKKENVQNMAKGLVIREATGPTRHPANK